MPRTERKLRRRSRVSQDRVPPKRVRFRRVNGSHARFYHLNFYAEDLSHPGEAKVGTPGPSMYEIGTERGFLLA